MPDKPWDDQDWKKNDALTSAEWNNHVEDGHFPSDEVNFGVNADGDPVMTDPQNTDDVIARYDRTEGGWVLPELEVSGLSGVSTLHGAGYQSGGFIPRVTGTVVSDDTTTSTSFQQLSGPSNFLSVSTDDFPADAQVAVKFYGYAMSGSDTESATFRLARQVDGAIPGTETSITSAGGEMIESPPVEITLNDGYWGTDTFVGEAKHETGNSTARIRAMRASIGVVLP